MSRSAAIPSRAFAESIDDVFTIMKKRIKFGVLLVVIVILSACSSIVPDTPTLAPTVQSPEITFEVTFDEDENCIVTGPAEVPTGEYSFLLHNQSERKVDVAITHLIDGHSYQDLLDLQEEYGEPFVKVYWMSQPNYFTRDHKIWYYYLDEAGEHAILLLQHVHVGIWICQPIQVVEPAAE